MSIALDILVKHCSVRAQLQLAEKLAVRIINNQLDAITTFYFKDTSKLTFANRNKNLLKGYI